jgi:chromosome segregation ATPase
MKKYFIGFVVGAVLAVIGGSIYLDWKTKDLQKQNAQMKQEWDAAKAQFLVQDKESQKKIEAAMAVISGLQGNIDSLNFENAKLTDQVFHQDTAIAGLEEENKKLKTKEVEAVIASNPALKKYVDNLLSQISANKAEVFTLKEKVENAEKRAASSEGKFAALEIAFGTCTADNLSLKGLLQKAETNMSRQAQTILDLGKRPTWMSFSLGTGGAVVVAVVTVLLILGRR